MDKEALLENVYNESFNDELEKMAKESKTHADKGAIAGAGYGATGLVLNKKKIKGIVKKSPLGRKGKVVAGALGIAGGIGTTTGVGAAIGSMFKKKGLNKTAEDPKTYAGTGAKIGVGYGIGAGILRRKKIKQHLMNTNLGRKGRIALGVAGIGAGLGVNAGLGAGVGSLFKRKNKK